MKSINPLNLEELNNYTEFSTAQVTSILKKTTEFFPKWKQTKFDNREALFQQLSDILLSKKQLLGQLATLEMGKPISQATAEIEKCALLCRFYAENGREFLQPKSLKTDYQSSIVTYEAIGGVLAVMPWNFPFWQVFRCVVPTIFAGNVAFLKHASNVPQCALTIEELFLEAGFPENTMNTLLIGHDEVEQVIEHDLVQAISVTGSNLAGSSVSSKAAKHIKKSVLELGGNDAFIVCNDANLNEAVQAAKVARFQNNGQSCIAAKRFFVQSECYQPFMELFRSEIADLIVGDPFDQETYIGPLAKQEFVTEIDRQVSESVKLGGRISLGGTTAGEHQQFYLPTIIEQVKPGMPAFDEEIFGPVAAVISFDEPDQAIELANQSIYGLGATIWSKNIQQAQEMASKLEVGTVVINDFVKSFPQFPFGGVKQSGFGRELSKEGIHEFVNIKVTHTK